MFETTTRLFPYFFSLPSISFSSLWKTWKAGVLGRVGRKGLGAFSLLACPISLSIMVVAVHTWGNINKHGRVKPHSQESGFFGGLVYFGRRFASFGSPSFYGVLVGCAGILGAN